MENDKKLEDYVFEAVIYLGERLDNCLGIFKFADDLFGPGLILPEIALRDLSFKLLYPLYLLFDVKETSSVL